MLIFLYFALYMYVCMSNHHEAVRIGVKLCNYFADVILHQWSIRGIPTVNVYKNAFPNSLAILDNSIMDPDIVVKLEMRGVQI